MDFIWFLSNIDRELQIRTVDNPGAAMAMMMTGDVTNALAVMAASVIVYRVMKFLWDAVWEPLRLGRIMAKQGVRGPPFRFLFGQFLEMDKFAKSFPENLPLDGFADLLPTSTPQFALYFSKYGTTYSILRQFLMQERSSSRALFLGI